MERKYTEDDMLAAAKYGYDYRKTTSFPEHNFEDACINNTKQWLQSYKFNEIDFIARELKYEKLRIELQETQKEHLKYSTGPSCQSLEYKNKANTLYKKIKNIKIGIISLEKS